MAKVCLSYLVFFLLLASLVSAENLYRAENLKTELSINSDFKLVPSASSYAVSYLKAKLLLYPENSFQQTLLNVNTYPSGEIEENDVLYRWNKPEELSFQLQAKYQVATTNAKLKIKNKISYPFLVPAELVKYTQPSEKIDSGDSSVIEQANKLAEGEDDLFKLVFKLASWTESNVHYDLSTLTATTSQKASWVLANKEGVCDEISTLFIAMARALGIPARFVTGIAYTESKQFAENWVPHGWAEVYFPGYGWVPYDVTFGEYGFIDPTHIELQESLDPETSSIKYEWLGKNINLKSGETKFAVIVLEKGAAEKSEIFITAQPFAPRIGIGSYNLILAEVENLNGYYTTATLNLAAPAEVKILERKKAIVLGPGEKKVVAWPVKLTEDLPSNYIFTFPLAVYSEKNVSAETSFIAKKAAEVYSYEEISKIIPVEKEEKKALPQLETNCKAKEEELLMGETTTVVCTLRNKGATTFSDLMVCLESNCQKTSLMLNEEKKFSYDFTAKALGGSILLFKVSSAQLEKKTPVKIAVMDLPEIEIKDAEYPNLVKYKDNFKVSFLLDKVSASEPEEVELVLSGPRGKTWKMDRLMNSRKFFLEMESSGLAKENHFFIQVKWKDKRGKEYVEEESFSVSVEATSFGDSLVMTFNGLVIWLENLF